MWLIKKIKDNFVKIWKKSWIGGHIFSDLRDDPVLNAIEIFSRRASVLKIKLARNSLVPYKHTTWIPRSNDVETNVESMWRVCRVSISLN